MLLDGPRRIPGSTRYDMFTGDYVLHLREYYQKRRSLAAWAEHNEKDWHALVQECEEFKMFYQLDGAEEWITRHKFASRLMAFLYCEAEDLSKLNSGYYSIKEFCKERKLTQKGFCSLTNHHELSLFYGEHYEKIAPELDLEYIASF